MIDLSVTASEEVGQLQVVHMKRYWHKCMLKRTGALKPDAFGDEFQLDKTMLSILGLGLEQTVKYLYTTAPSFGEFEQWVVEVSGKPLQENIIRFNNTILSRDTSGGQPIPNVLNEEQLDFWDKNGYIILRNAVSQEDCDKTIGVICDFIEIDRNDPATWYNQHPARQGIMVQLFQHPILDKNRNSAIIRAAHEQLWNRTDVWVNADRVGFNPPETERWKFPGPRLHWDTKLKLPIPFNVQGILYLADTAENQGAFSLVPGFQHRIDDWLTGLNGKNPYNEDLHALGCIPIAANAGDFIIWHHALPHGSSANTSDKPRFVQYFTYAPVDAEG